jgi:hypothetical protein
MDFKTPFTHHTLRHDCCDGYPPSPPPPHTRLYSRNPLLLLHLLHPPHTPTHGNVLFVFFFPQAEKFFKENNMSIPETEQVSASADQIEVGLCTLNQVESS